MSIKVSVPDLKACWHECRCGKKGLFYSPKVAAILIGKAKAKAKAIVKTDQMECLLTLVGLFQSRSVLIT